MDTREKNSRCKKLITQEKTSKLKKKPQNSSLKLKFSALLRKKQIFVHWNFGLLSNFTLWKALELQSLLKGAWSNQKFSVISNLVPQTVVSENKLNSTGKTQGKNSKTQEKTQNSREKLKVQEALASYVYPSGVKTKSLT